MTARYQQDLLATRQEIVAPPAPRSCEDHSFELPSGLYLASAIFLFGFVGLTAMGLAHRELVVPMGITIFFLAMFFAIPTMFIRTTPARKRALTLSELMARGIDTATGQTSGREAVILVLMLPALIFCWGIAVVVIAALV